MATWNFENDYVKECFDAKIPSYTVEEPLTKVPHVGIHYHLSTPPEKGEFYCFDEAKFEYLCVDENPYTRRQ